MMRMKMAVLGMAAMAMAGTPGYGLPSVRIPQPIDPRRPGLPPLRHEGYIPKGCKVHEGEMVLSKHGFLIQFKFQVVAATVKARDKKTRTLIAQVEDFISSRQRMESLKDNTDFIIVEDNNNKNNFSE